MTEWTEIRERLESLKEDIEEEAEQGDRDYHETLYELESSIDRYENALQGYYLEKRDLED